MYQEHIVSTWHGFYEGINFNSDTSGKLRSHQPTGCRHAKTVHSLDRLSTAAHFSVVAEDVEKKPSFF